MKPEAFGEEYFRSCYTDYEAQNPLSKMVWYEEAVRRWTDYIPISLLDIGCGLGAFAAHMSRQPDVVVHASDVSEFAISKNRSRFPAVHWKVASASTTPWPTESFDVVTALDVLEHLDDPSQALHSATNMLKPGGSLIAVVPVYDGPTGPLIKRLDHDPTHVNRWSRRAWIQLIGSQLTVVDWVGVFRYRIPHGPYLHYPSRRLRGATPAVMIVSKRT